MANPEHLKILKQGVEVWNKWRENEPRVKPDLSGLDCHEAHFPDVNFVRANLTGVNFFRAVLLHAKFDFADLSNSVLSAAILDNTSFFSTIIYNSKIIEASMLKAVLSSAILTNSKFHGLIIGWTNFSDVDLSSVDGLAHVEHRGPSSIGIDTIYKSHGQIPEIFLKGCGVPEKFIQYMSSLTGKAFEYYSCFISYSSKDQDFSERLYADLQNNGVRCWFAPEDMKGGKKIYPQLDEAIKLHDKLLLIISENSMNSDWVASEIKRARKREKETGRQKLFPIRLVDFESLKQWELFDSDTATDLAAEVRSYSIPDFTQWKDHDAYQKAFDKLMGDLKAEEPVGTD